MKTFFSALMLFFCLLGTSLWAHEESCERYYDPYDHGYYDYVPYYNHGVYSTGCYATPAVYVSSGDRYERRHHDHWGYGRRWDRDYCY